MTDEASETDQAEADASYQQRLREKGFVGSEPVHEAYNCFTLEEAKASMFDSTYSKVIPVYLENEHKSARIPVVLTRAELRFEPYTVYLNDAPAGCSEQPDWYFEGWVLKSGFDQFEGICRIRMYVNSGFDDVFQWQVITDKPEDGNPIKITCD